jgi:branched-chain amino acid transport system ATP-binding protein
MTWGRGSGSAPAGRVGLGGLVTAILETQQLRKEFGALVAVDDVSVQIEQGSLHSIIGPNGAGKTTFFNLVSGTLEPTAGRVFYRGDDITDLPVHRTIHRGIGRSFQITNIFPNLTVFENVRLAGQAMRAGSFRLFRSHRSLPEPAVRAHEVLERVGLADKAWSPARTLPHGDQRKLELGMILAPDPDVLMLDEPTAGMAAEQVPELMALVQEIQTAGDKTVVLVEHNMNVVMAVSDRITVMHQGALLAEGSPAEISADQRVQTAYLGELYREGDGAG